MSAGEAPARASAAGPTTRATPRAATSAVFFINGALVGTWAAHIPAIQDRLGISKATVGLTLLCMALGSLVAMPLAGQILASRPSASVTRFAALLACPLLVLPHLGPSALAVGGALVLFGAANGAMDVSMNAHGVAVERDLGRPIMSSLHAGWSFGGFAAAGVAALSTSAGVDFRVEAAVVSGALVLASLWVTRRLGDASSHSHEGGAGLAWPSRKVLLLGLLCFLVMVTEGAMNDWSGIYLRHNLGAGAGAASTGFAGFSLGMAFGRVAGDALTARLGAERVLRGGMACVAVVLGALLAIAQPVPAVVGFALVGAGLANSVPLLFSAAGRVPPAGPSLAAVFSVGYMGFIVGPPLIGIVSDAVGLPAALAGLCGAAVLVTLLGGRALAAGRAAAGAQGAVSPAAAR